MWGGHYLTDVLVGAVLGLIAYAAARCLLEARLISPVERLLSERSLTRLLLELLIFVWIVQVTVEFREVTWVQTVLRFFFG
jgi:hypothetical protein